MNVKNMDVILFAFQFKLYFNYNKMFSDLEMWVEIAGLVYLVYSASNKLLKKPRVLIYAISRIKDQKNYLKQVMGFGYCEIELVGELSRLRLEQVEVF